MSDENEHATEQEYTGVSKEFVEMALSTMADTIDLPEGETFDFKITISASEDDSQ